MVIPDYMLGLLIALCSGVVGYFISHLLRQQEVTDLQTQRARMQAQLDGEHKANMMRMRTQEQSKDQLMMSFKALAGDALKNNSSEFLKLAEENLKQHQAHADVTLSARQKAVEALVEPISKALEKTEHQVRVMEKERQHAFGSLSQQIQLMTEANALLKGETRNLSQALRRPEIRGQWGELTLKRLAELAGMSEHSDFYQQENLSTEQGAVRPDMIVRLSDRREIIIDAKTPLDAYLSAVEAKSDEERKRHLKRHARAVRERVKELSGKHYWQHLPRSPEYVVLFIPGDQFLSCALEIDPQLLEDAIASRVVLATPTSLVALLRTIAYGWKQKVLAENSEQIRKTGEEMYERLSLFSEHLGKVGKSLNNSVDAYNKAVGSFDTRVLPGVRRFSELGISGRKEINEINKVTQQARAVVSDHDQHK
ncbi:MAG: DNA recombination protein RmuC [Gammaproteobacteria bacterium]